MTVRLIAKVAVDKAAFHFDKLYDYLIPVEYGSAAKVGCRVLVPFGAGNRKRQGVILALEQLKSDEHTHKIKPIHLLLDEEVYLTQELLELVYYLKENTFCTYYDAVKTLLPAGVGYNLGFVYHVNPHPQSDISVLTHEEQALVDYLKSRKAPILKEKLCEVFGLTPENPLLKKLTAEGWLLCEETAKRKIGDETVTMVRLYGDCTEGVPDNIKLTAKQRAVLELLCNVGTASVKEIGYFTGTTSAVVKALEKKGYVELFENEVFRSPVTASSVQAEQTVLTAHQQLAYEGIKALYDKNQPAVSLLYGVTGSGKTSVFVRLIEKMVEQHRQVIVLVPEISLTPQAIEVFTSRFGKRVAILHSGLSMGERLDEWKRIRTGQVDIAVGTRSAVFAPFENLGMIIIDEEQESTYKSEASPRYHAREVAKVRILRHNAHLLLCSATPSVESYYHAKTGRYHLFTLNERFGDAVLPSVSVVDMDAEQREGNFMSISHVLGEQIAENLRNKQQTILLLNRRGYNTLVKCTSCNTAVSCPHCSIGLTYHHANGRLMCHYCGYSRELTQKCEVCGSEYVKYAGAGTQKLEEELKMLFPSARILRMDADTTMAKHAYEQNFKQFADGEYDIMVGTQMVAKGLNFPNVTLVGVLSADSTLFGDNFKSEERTFSLLTQVVGRSGRGELHGRAYIQTHFPDNEIFAMAAEQDYQRFYENEIATRKIMLYPPFCQMCAVGFSGENEREVIAAAQYFQKCLTETAKQNYPDLPLRILGVTPNIVLRVSGKFRYKIIIKCSGSKQFRAMMAAVLIQFAKQRSIKGISVYADLYFDGTI
ncbi:replication restart DNA helicase PriA [Hydrogenoanaerobacterium saccharovorans]|uniref:Replication restart protein PriA n=1 Tax=Hydrogenoanaerobacterium saccharovorans TaxID=474960 RepID=A0A1H8D6M8_9FIRM|nr:primosomal protein N' [Hydrogenoanaerobacterium saccharovorans]RPF43485.1 replication restart DNA helicase PriA [Hydrogenoanaerobacterium saccharovorans]SEN02147.1 replication restart DNA helicase PriA [Hydrogenoanaerobacterium saccharovorans]